MLFPQFVEAIVRVCLAQYAVAPQRQAARDAVQRHKDAVAAAREEATKAALAAASAADGKKKGKKGSADATVEPAADLSVLERPAPPMPASLSLLPLDAPLSAKLEHFLTHTLLRRHKVGGVDESRLATSVAEERVKGTA